jgi:NYN domain/OST-HTH/LOTUS domain
VKRIYADWTSPGMKTWKEELNSHAVRPIQKFAYTKSKGSTDTGDGRYYSTLLADYLNTHFSYLPLALIIDAMDLLHSKLVDGFCIVSSDSDYTGLAHRIREEGMFIMGIGKRHTPEAFIKACESFTYSEILVEPPVKVVSTKKKIDSSKQEADITSISPVSSPAWTQFVDYNLFKRAFRIAVNIDNGKAKLSRLSDELRKLDPTFDHRNFGFPSFRKFCETPTMKEMYETSIERDGTTLLITERTYTSDIGNEIVVADARSEAVIDPSVLHDEAAAVPDVAQKPQSKKETKVASKPVNRAKKPKPKSNSQIKKEAKQYAENIEQAKMAVPAAHKVKFFGGSEKTPDTPVVSYDWDT